MKQLFLLALFGAFSLSASGQIQSQIFTEAKDTIITAYNIKNFTDRGGKIQVQRDSVGLDSVRVHRLYYTIDMPRKSTDPNIGEYTVKVKRYLPRSLYIEYFSEPKGKDERTQN